MLTWPNELKPESGGYAPLVRNLSGGPSFSGFDQVITQMTDRWGAAFSFNVNSQPQKLAMRALLTRLRGRSGTVGLPAFDRVRPPRAADTPGAPINVTVVNPPFYLRWPDVAGTTYEFTPLDAVTGTATIQSATSFSFAATGLPPAPGMFSTLNGVKREIVTVSGGGPYVCQFRPSLALASPVLGGLAATVNAGAALNATGLSVLIATGVAPMPGHLFSVGSRLHSIDTVTPAGAGVYALGIWPWLRAAVTAGTVVNFTAPLCEMRLASDGEGVEGLRALEGMRFGRVTLAFEESAA